ncbi:MAG: hypothetical protein LKM37_01345 [Bacteroidales bacterium]|jgi:outer membrane protein OmpA-like peptidoglycan-associated protein|nr:hypothetical protein [Bacteroidales bacterium]MCI1733137.1 hypothetical protein [Bacteroidales bacterium]
MNFKKLFLTVAVCAFAVSSVAAQSVKGTEAQTKRGPYETNRFFDNVFLGVGGGVNYYQGEEDLNADFSKRLAPALNAYIGKWITPCVGVRLSYNGLSQRGWTSNKNSAYANGTQDNGYKQEFNMSYARADIMWNISNAISGYRSDRFWDIAPYVGGGAAYASAKHSPRHGNWELAATAGIYNMFRVAKALDITLDLSQTYVNQRWDGEAYKSRQEYFATVSLGLAYQFRVRDFSRAHSATDLTPYNNKIKDLNDALAAANAKNNQLQKDLNDANNRPAKEVVVNGENTKSATPVALFFPLGKSTLDETQLMNLDFYVKNAMKVDSNHTFTVTGSADSATGSKKINDKLGVDRMNKVYDLLVNKYGISKDKLVKQSIGGTDKYSSKTNRLNRCVVIE